LLDFTCAPRNPLLLELQKTDTEIAALRANLDTAPKRIRENEAQIKPVREPPVAAAKDTLAQAAATRKKNRICSCRMARTHQEIQVANRRGQNQ